MSSDLAADRALVLHHATSMHGVNQELAPLLRMTAPEEYTGRSLFEAPVGQPLFRSWVLLGGFLPIDYDHLAFEAIDPESGFVESSTMLSMRSWRHARHVTALPNGGCRLVDELTFVPRVPGSGAVLLPIVRAVFRHRHARLRALFSEAHLPARKLTQEAVRHVDA